MSNRSQNIGNIIASFIGLGVFIVLLICAIVFLSYVFVIGAVIGLVFFIIAFIRSKIQKRSHAHPFIGKDGKRHRTIDQD